MFTNFYFNIIIVDDDDVPDLKELMKKKKRTFEVSRPQAFFHTEFNILPGTSPTVTDLVLYGPLFRLFKYPEAAKNERTWQEGDLTWVAWSHRYKFYFTVLSVVKKKWSVIEMIYSSIIMYIFFRFTRIY